MSQDEQMLEKSSSVEIAAGDDAARALVRLIQCPRCSRPFRTPVTLPCGRSMCRECLPARYQRENISYPDSPDRREGIVCPFMECGREHPWMDCSQDVVLAKVMDAVAVVVARHTSLSNPTPATIDQIGATNADALDALAEATLAMPVPFQSATDGLDPEKAALAEASHDISSSLDSAVGHLAQRSADDAVVSDAVNEKSEPLDVESSEFSENVDSQTEGDAFASNEKISPIELPASRLLAAYALAAQGTLSRDAELNLPTRESSDDSERANDLIVTQDFLEAANKEVDCQVCYSVMLDPVTTYCGHTLCRRCMARVLDHSLHCPVCRRALAIPPLLARHPSNKTLVDLLEGLSPELMAARAEAAAAEDAVGQGDLKYPLFVCTLGFPHQPTLLRIFEPRYRLMMRRCVESNREFGILMWNRYGEPQGDLGPVHFYHYGTMLYIIQSQLFPDGTSVIESRGTYRFRVKAHDMLDGYSIGSVERIEDVSLAEEERIEAEETALPAVEEGDVAGQIERMSTRDLLAMGHEFVTKMHARSATWLRQRALDIYGLPPHNAALFPYWFASVLPISDEEKYKLLPTRTVRERLKITATWIKRIESQRW